jgi:CHAT domain-containing protein
MPSKANLNLPSAKEYFVFDLAITSAGQNKYRAQVRSSPAGETWGAFNYVVVPSELERLRVHVSPGVGGDVNVIGPGDDEIKAFGDRLYNLVFNRDVYAVLQQSIEIADAANKNLRLRLNLSETPELAALPWEYLYDGARNLFFSLSIETPLVRYFELSERVKPLRIELPLRILVLVSSGTEEDDSAAKREADNLDEALQDLRVGGVVTLKRIEKATISNLQSLLRRNEFHILHYIGKSTFDEQTGAGMLMLHDDRGNPKPTSGELLGVLLRDHQSMRLVILNSDGSARSNSTNVFSGIAPTLIQQGIPAVVAMQSDISHEAARIFTQGFYQALADNSPIDAALIDARKSMLFAGFSAEWATPVLYMRAPDGVLFKFDGATNDAASPDLYPNDFGSNQFGGTVKGAPAGQAFSPIGSWNIQVQDMVGSRLFVQFKDNGTFQMQQQVGMYQVPVTGNWNFNPGTHQLALQGVVNTFQPFILSLTLGSPVPNGFVATGSDGIGYVLTRAEN